VVIQASDGSLLLDAVATTSEMTSPAHTASFGKRLPTFAK